MTLPSWSSPNRPANASPVKPAPLSHKNSLVREINLPRIFEENTFQSKLPSKPSAGLCSLAFLKNQELQKQEKPKFVRKRSVPIRFSVSNGARS